MPLAPRKYEKDGCQRLVPATVAGTPSRRWVSGKAILISPTVPSPLGNPLFRHPHQCGEVRALARRQQGIAALSKELHYQELHLVQLLTN